ncbi:Bud site selection protein 6 [Mycena kentingensis (nom. inval.)]|nr:Bud site selection protein 6 [Mycena kentingensis (nom. inval.)]
MAATTAMRNGAGSATPYLSVNTTTTHMQPYPQTQAQAQYTRGGPADVGACVRRLLLSTKELPASLTRWARGEVSETDVSDVYVRVGTDFNAAVQAFALHKIDLSDLHSVPTELRTVLEQCLAEDPSQEVLDTFMPGLREVLVKLLHGLKARQPAWQRAKYVHASPASANGSPSPGGIDIQFASASASAFPSPIAVSSSSSSSGPSSHGSVVAAAVGGSVGAVVAIVLGFAVLWFQLKRRERSGGAWHPFFDSTTSSSESLAPTLERRFASLEKEVASLRAEVTRLSARERGRGGGLVARGPSLIYTREKANEALRDPRRESDKSSVPPLYGD